MRAHLALVLCLSLTIVATTDDAHADIAPPPGQVKVPVTWTVNTGQLAKDYTLALLTTRRSDSETFGLRWDKLSGDVPVNSGYMLKNQIVAFKPAQLSAFAKAYVATLDDGAPHKAAAEGKSTEELAAWIKTVTFDHQTGNQALADYFRGSKLPMTDDLYFDMITKESQAQSPMKMTANLGAVGADGVIATDVKFPAPKKQAAATSPTKEEAAAKKKGCTAAGGSAAWLWALALLTLVALRRRRQLVA
jgi:MYXO-CTERM domain-containing protein